MPKIAEIVAIINTNLKTNQFDSKRFQKGQYNALAELVKTETGETWPCTIDNSGDETRVGLDDTYPLIAYHRVISIESEHDEEQDFGDLRLIKETANMRWVFWGDRSRLSNTQEQIISGVEAGLTLELTNAQLTSHTLYACEIIPGQIITDKEEVFQQEYGTDEVKLKTGHFMFAFNYQIVTEVYKSCYTACS